MIQIEPHNLLLLPLALSLVAVFLCWLYYLVARAKKEATVKARIYRCTVCQHVYADTRDVPLARCPKCGGLNSAVKR